MIILSRVFKMDYYLFSNTICIAWNFEYLAQYCVDVDNGDLEYSPFPTKQSPSEGNFIVICLEYWNLWIKIYWWLLRVTYVIANQVMVPLKQFLGCQHAGNTKLNRFETSK